MPFPLRGSRILSRFDLISTLIVFRFGLEYLGREDIFDASVLDFSFLLFDEVSFFLSFFGNASKTRFRGNVASSVVYQTSRLQLPFQFRI